MNFEERLAELMESKTYTANEVAKIAEEMIEEVGAYQILTEALLILSTSDELELLLDVATNLDI